MNTKLDILNKIKSGEIDMKPRWHFVLKSLLAVVGIIVVALCVVYLLSFVLFALRQSGVGFAPLYGFRGLSIFVMSSPWLLIASAGAFAALLYVLVSRYSFSYQRPLIYSMFGVVLAVLVGSFILVQTSVHKNLRQYAKENNVPGLAPLYRGIDDRRPDNLTAGTVIAAQKNEFTIQSVEDETLTVVITENTKQRKGVGYEAGETMFVFGDREGDTITAFAIRPAPADFDTKHRPPKRGKGPRGR